MPVPVGTAVGDRIGAVAVGLGVIVGEGATREDDAIPNVFALATVTGPATERPLAPASKLTITVLAPV